MKTEDMIAQLTEHLAPVRRLPSPATLTLLWLGIALLVVVSAVAVMGLRPDLDARMAAGLDLRQMATAGLTGVLAALAAFQLSFPDRDRRWALLPLPALVLWLGNLGWGCLQDFAAHGPDGVRLTTSFPCLAFVLGFGLPLSLAMAWLARHAAPIRPGPVAVLGGLAAACITNIGLTLTHHLDAAAMVLAWHGLAMLVTTGAAGLLGPKVMRIAV
ncbi:MAG: NrsF family protein [Pseudomonadota bacterium]